MSVVIVDVLLGTSLDREDGGVLQESIV